MGTLVKPGTKLRLADHDPDFCEDLDKDAPEVDQRREKALDRMAALQERLYAEGKQSLLIVLQAMDAGGKDGTIKHVMRGLNPAGCTVAAFKAPTPLELSHDFLWRIHEQTPSKGQIAVFNRSHYEDVLVVRVHELVPDTVWRKRYDHINHFERLLADSGTRIIKLYLHISKEEQRERLQERIDDPEKHWKINPQDIAERARWAEYMRAFEDALSLCSTDYAPWHVIPANRKWYRDMIVAELVADTLEDMNPQWPESEFDVTKIVVE